LHKQEEEYSFSDPLPPSPPPPSTTSLKVNEFLVLTRVPSSRNHRKSAAPSFNMVMILHLLQQQLGDSARKEKTKKKKKKKLHKLSAEVETNKSFKLFSLGALPLLHYKLQHWQCRRQR
jgi:hypothetical protein